MLVRTFALWSALGVSVATVSAFLVPTRSASGSPRPEPGLAPDPAGQPTAPAAHFVDGKALLLDGRLGHASVARSDRGRAASTFLLATVTGADGDGGPSVAAPRAHLAIVVDRSGSMAGAKMNNAIAAAVGAVERMHDGDRATVVAFDSTARLLVPPTTVDGASRPSIEATLRGIRPGGDTCISCALERATEALVASPGDRDEVQRVLLISDGEATTGVRDVGGLRGFAARARDRGIAVSTIGVDLAFDEKVMAAIAEESNGRHWFVPDASALGQVFDQELGSLQSAVATDAELTIEPAPGVVLEDVRDRSFRREGSRLVVPLGAFDRLQERTVLVGVRVPADLDGTQPVATVSLGYRDVAGHEDARCSGSLAVDVRDDGSAQSDLDPFVAARVERSRTEHALLDANDLFARGRATEARAELARRQDDIARAAPSAVSRAMALPRPAAGAARDVGGDFDEQKKVLLEAQVGFAAPAAPPGAPPASTPAAKSALKANQANATELTH
jgi:Ca-activated chloride channel homolog